MHGRFGIDIPKGQHLAIVVDDIGGDLASGDLEKMQSFMMHTPFDSQIPTTDKSVR